MPRPKYRFRETVDVVPQGEEDRHITAASCECGPEISNDADGRTVIVHNSWDGREGFGRAGQDQPIVCEAKRVA